jgi:hypothetical protein
MEIENNNDGTLDDENRIDDDEILLVSQEMMVIIVNGILPSFALSRDILRGKTEVRNMGRLIV